MRQCAGDGENRDFVDHVRDLRSFDDRASQPNPLDFHRAAWFALLDRRDRALYDAERSKLSFHCIRCDHLYTEKAGTETSPCPKCGHSNPRLKF